MKSVVVENVPALAISFAFASALVPWLLGCQREAILICILVASLQLEMGWGEGRLWIIIDDHYEYDDEGIEPLVFNCHL